jgi:hypothetical protein
MNDQQELVQSLVLAAWRARHPRDEAKAALEQMTPRQMTPLLSITSTPSTDSFNFKCDHGTVKSFMPVNTTYEGFMNAMSLIVAFAVQRCGCKPVDVFHDWRSIGDAITFFEGATPASKALAPFMTPDETYEATRRGWDDLGKADLDGMAVHSLRTHECPTCDAGLRTSSRQGVVTRRAIHRPECLSRSS